MRPGGAIVALNANTVASIWLKPELREHTLGDIK
jgi:hypothetical protein